MRDTYTSDIGVSYIQISSNQYKFNFGISQVTIAAGEKNPLKEEDKAGQEMHSSERVLTLCSSR